MTISRLKELPREEIIREMAKQFGDLNPSSLEAMIMLYKFLGDYDKAFEDHFKKFGLSDGRFHVLITIKKNNNAIKATDIANNLGVSRATMTGLMDGLIKDGLISKTDCSEDRRISFVHLTEKGQELLGKVVPCHFKKLDKFSQCLNKEEVKVFKECISKLSNNLDKIAKD